MGTFLLCLFFALPMVYLAGGLISLVFWRLYLGPSTNSLQRSMSGWFLIGFSLAWPYILYLYLKGKLRS